MSGRSPGSEPSLRYQPDEKPPLRLALGVGLQLAVLNIAAVMLIPIVVMRAAGTSDAYLSWAVLASVTICGMATILQARRAGRIGMGHVMVMGTSGAFIPASIMALDQGGPALLASLVAISAARPASSFVAALALPAHPDARGLGHRDHAHSGHGHAVHR